MVYTPELSQEELEVTDSYSLYLKTLDNYRNMLEAGIIDSDQFDEMVRYTTKVELPSYLAEELGIDEDTDEYGDLKYSSGSDLAEFSENATSFGTALLELGELAGFDDVEEYAITLGEAINVDPTDLLLCISGELEPDNDLVVDISEVMELPEEYAVALLEAAYEARGEDLYEALEDEENDEEYEDEDDIYDEYEDEEDEEDEALEEVAYSIANVEDRLAEFEVAEAVRNRLANIEDLVDIGLEERWLTPNKAHQILGDFNREEDRVAAFSQMASANGVDLETQLYALEYALNLDSKSGAVVQFGAYSDENYEPTDEDRDILQQAKLNVLSAQNKFIN